MRSKFQLNATMVANEFIDQYMPAAGGEYVKVYLYLLRHQEREVEVAEVADALNLTEADIKRATAYWVRQGVLLQEEHKKEADGVGEGGRVQEALGAPGAEPPPKAPERIVIQEEAPVQRAERPREEPMPQRGPDQGEYKPDQRPHYTPEQVGRLAEEEDFTQLLYISQKYMNKVFTPRECEVFAYLYDALHMSAELLEYLVEYCVQGEHYSIRYLETVALDWHRRNIRTVDMARQHTAMFSDETFSVMRAFGLSERRPGDAELDMIRRWFKQWGFTKELVLEACARTLKAIHGPSFSYADKILSEWRNAGVKNMTDVKMLDEKRESKKTAKTGTAVSRQTKNQFHNFEQRTTDYDGMVLERLKQRLETQ